MAARDPAQLTIGTQRRVRASRTAVSRRDGRSFLADVFAGAPAPFCEVARAVCSAALALACLRTPPGNPAGWGRGTPCCSRARQVGLGIRVSGRLGVRTWRSSCQLLSSIPTSPTRLEANTTLPVTVPAFLLGAGSSTETIQAVGIVWIWSCYALAASRKVQTRR